MGSRLAIAGILTLALFAMVPSTGAQQTRVYRIGVVLQGGSYSAAIDRLRDGLRELLHKPHIATHSQRAFVDTNVTGALTLLEEAARAGVRAFVFTSMTSAFGQALIPPPGSHDRTFADGPYPVA